MQNLEKWNRCYYYTVHYDLITNVTVSQKKYYGSATCVRRETVLYISALITGVPLLTVNEKFCIFLHCLIIIFMTVYITLIKNNYQYNIV